MNILQIHETTRSGGASVSLARLHRGFLDAGHDATILAGDSPNAHNDIARPDRVVPEKTELTFKNGTVDLPPHSLTILTHVRMR